MKLLSMGPLSALAALCLSLPLPLAAATSKAQIKQEIESTALKFFLDEAHPQTGLVRDRAENFEVTPEWNRVASIASTGFGLAVVAHAAKHGKMAEKDAQDYVLRALRFCRDNVPRRKGWFLHFIDWETGERMWGSEYSTIDTALFLAGALYAAQVFPQNAEIQQITYQLYTEADFIDSMTDSGTRPQKRSISMAYTEEDGFTPAQWDMYAEQLVLLILGLGHPTQPLPLDSWLHWERKLQHLPNGQEVYGLDAALFIHQYSQVFLDFRKFNDGFMNYHDNGRVMSEWHRQISLDDKRFKTLQEGFWGFSAGESATGYKVWNPLHYESTVCTGCTVASAMYMPDQVLTDVAAWYDSPYKDQIWGKYGFIDSLDLDQNWFSSGVLGITVGPAYMALVNIDENTSIWKDFMKIPAVQLGMERASQAKKAAPALMQAASDSADVPSLQ